MTHFNQLTTEQNKNSAVHTQELLEKYEQLNKAIESTQKKINILYDQITRLKKSFDISFEELKSNNKTSSSEEKPVTTEANNLSNKQYTAHCEKHFRKMLEYDKLQKKLLEIKNDRDNLNLASTNQRVQNKIIANVLTKALQENLKPILSKHVIFIQGGALSDLINNMPPCDIDLFLVDKADNNMLIKQGFIASRHVNNLWIKYINISNQRIKIDLRITDGITKPFFKHCALLFNLKTNELRNVDTPLATACAENRTLMLNASAETVIKQSTPDRALWAAHLITHHQFHFANKETEQVIKNIAKRTHHLYPEKLSSKIKQYSFVSDNHIVAFWKKIFEWHIIDTLYFRENHPGLYKLNQPIINWPENNIELIRTIKALTKSDPLYIIAQVGNQTSSNHQELPFYHVSHNLACSNTSFDYILPTQRRALLIEEKPTSTTIQTTNKLSRIASPENQDFESNTPTQTSSSKQLIKKKTNRHKATIKQTVQKSKKNNHVKKQKNIQPGFTKQDAAYWLLVCSTLDWGGQASLKRTRAWLRSANEPSELSNRIKGVSFQTTVDSTNLNQKLLIKTTANKSLHLPFQLENAQSLVLNSAFLESPTDQPNEIKNLLIKHAHETHQLAASCCITMAELFIRNKKKGINLKLAFDYLQRAARLNNTLAQALFKRFLLGIYYTGKMTSKESTTDEFTKNKELRNEYLNLINWLLKQKNRRFSEEYYVLHKMLIPFLNALNHPTRNSFIAKLSSETSASNLELLIKDFYFKPKKPYTTTKKTVFSKELMTLFKRQHPTAIFLCMKTSPFENHVALFKESNGDTTRDNRSSIEDAIKTLKKHLRMNNNHPIIATYIKELTPTLFSALLAKKQFKAASKLFTDLPYIIEQQLAFCFLVGSSLLDINTTTIIIDKYQSLEPKTNKHLNADTFLFAALNKPKKLYNTSIAIRKKLISSPLGLLSGDECLAIWHLYPELLLNKKHILLLKKLSPIIMQNDVRNKPGPFRKARKKLGEVQYGLALLSKGLYRENYLRASSNNGITKATYLHSTWNDFTSPKKSNGPTHLHQSLSLLGANQPILDHVIKDIEACDEAPHLKNLSLLFYLGLAANRGNAQAQYQLALFLIDSDLAARKEEFLLKAALQGHENAQKELANSITPVKTASIFTFFSFKNNLDAEDIFNDIISHKMLSENQLNALNLATRWTSPTAYLLRGLYKLYQQDVTSIDDLIKAIEWFKYKKLTSSKLKPVYHYHPYKKRVEIIKQTLQITKNEATEPPIDELNTKKTLNLLKALLILTKNKPMPTKSEIDITINNVILKLTPKTLSLEF